MKFRKAVSSPPLKDLGPKQNFVRAAAELLGVSKRDVYGILPVAGLDDRRSQALRCVRTALALVDPLEDPTLTAAVLGGSLPVRHRAALKLLEQVEARGVGTMGTTFADLTQLYPRRLARRRFDQVIRDLVAGRYKAPRALAKLLSSPNEAEDDLYAEIKEARRIRAPRKR